MNNEYVNHYIELLTATMQDAILRNVSLQANAKVLENNTEAFKKENEELRSILDSQNSGSSDAIKNLEQQIKKLQDENGALKTFENEFRNAQSQAQHVDTFRNELLKARNEIEELKKQIDYLQLTPAQKRKVDNAKAKVEAKPTVLTIASQEPQVEDGGSF